MLLFRPTQSSLRLSKVYLPRHARPFHLSPVAAAVPLPPRRILKEEDIQEAFVHGTGPGGQKINKTACAVQLKHLPTGITTKSQATRSRSQNRKIARRTLAEKIDALEKGPESRTAIKAEIKARKKASKSKKSRRKYRTTEEGEMGGERGEEADAKGKEKEIATEKEVV